MTERLLRAVVVLLAALLALAVVDALGIRLRPVDYDVVTLCREDPVDHGDLLDKAASEGWRYVGTLNNNGINCTEVLLAR